MVTTAPTTDKSAMISDLSAGEFRQASLGRIRTAYPVRKVMFTGWMNLPVKVASGSEVFNGALPITNSSDSNDGYWDKRKPVHSILVSATVVKRGFAVID